METNFTTIRIDIEIFKLIQNNLVSFSETPNDVLRRLLGIDKNKSNNPSKKSTSELKSGNTNGLTVKGVTFNDGTELRGSHNGSTYIIHVKNGKFHFNGETYNYPSAVGSAITGSATDGWKFLHYLNNQTGRWEPIKNLRISITQRNRKN